MTQELAHQKRQKQAPLSHQNPKQTSFAQHGGGEQSSNQRTKNFSTLKFSQHQKPV